MNKTIKTFGAVICAAALALLAAPPTQGQGVSGGSTSVTVTNGLFSGGGGNYDAGLITNVQTPSLVGGITNTYHKGGTFSGPTNVNGLFTNGTFYGGSFNGATNVNPVITGGTVTVTNPVVVGGNFSGITNTGSLNPNSTFIGPTFGGVVTNLFLTNAAPSSVTIGVTAADFWQRAYNANGGLIGFMPVWTNH